MGGNDRASLKDDSLGASDSDATLRPPRVAQVYRLGEIDAARRSRVKGPSEPDALLRGQTEKDLRETALACILDASPLSEGQFFEEQSPEPCLAFRFLRKIGFYTIFLFAI